MNYNPDPSQPGEQAAPGPDFQPSFYGTFPVQPGAPEYYPNQAMPPGMPAYPPMGSGPVYPPGPGFPPAPGYMPPPPPFMPPGMVPMYPPVKKKRTWLWVLLGSIAVFVVLLTVACSVLFASIGQLAKTSSRTTSQRLYAQETQLASGATTSTSDGSSTGSSSSSSDTTGTSMVVNLGQKITSQGVDCTVVSVQKIEGDGYAQPQAGKQLIVTHIKLENHSTRSRPYNVFDFHIITGGQVHSEFIFTPHAYTANNRLHYGNILASSSIEGDIFFEVLIGDHQAKVSWEPAWVYSQAQYEWNLGL